MISLNTKYPILELNISLTHMPEPVYRMVVVRTGTSLRELHHIIQAVMPWDNAHLYEFTRSVGGRIIPYCETAMWQGEVPLENDDMLYFVEDVFKNVGDELTYVYDMGDRWEHRIILEDVITDPFMYPVLPMVVEGHGVCPPDDCGGVPGYLALRKSVSENKGKKYKEVKAWLARKGWGDEGFDVEMCAWNLNEMKQDMMDYYFPDEDEDDDEDE